jgi:hypothetical protein
MHAIIHGCLHKKESMLITWCMIPRHNITMLSFYSHCRLASVNELLYKFPIIGEVGINITIIAIILVDAND